MKTKIFATSILLMAFVLSACAAPTPDASQNPAPDSGQTSAQNQGQTSAQNQGQTSDQNQGQTSAQNQGQGGGGGGQRNSLESRLAIGTLKLEGTGQAVTADEAKQLLPLWQQVDTLSANSSTSATDMQTAYQNIEKAMTPDQITAIQNMSLSQTDIQDLIKSLGITPSAGGFGGPGGPNNGTPFPTMDPNQRATRQAQRTLTPGNGGGPGGGRGGGFGFNRMFVSPLIALLQKRAGG